MTKEGFIEEITRKLCENVQLDKQEINTIIRALRESEHYFQEPYYEVIYHDKYDNTETRIMNPVDSKISQMPSGEFIQEDHFDLLAEIVIGIDSVVITVAIVFTLLFGAYKIATAHDEKLWNDGHCDICGGAWQYEQAVGHRSSTSYIYICEDCGKRIEISEVK